MGLRYSIPAHRTLKMCIRDSDNTALLIKPVRSKVVGEHALPVAFYGIVDRMPVPDVYKRQGMVRQMQQLFYGKRYSATCLRRRKGCPDECKGPNLSLIHILNPSRQS